MIRSLAKFLMYSSGIYALIGYIFLALYFIGILLSVFFNEVVFLTSLLPTLINFLDTLLSNGFIGLITLMLFVGHFFFAYHASNVFKRLSEKDGKYTKKEREEYIMYLLFLMILFFIFL